MPRMLADGQRYLPIILPSEAGKTKIFVSKNIEQRPERQLWKVAIIGIFLRQSIVSVKRSNKEYNKEYKMEHLGTLLAPARIF